MGTEAIQWIAIGASLMGSATILALKILDRRSSKKKEIPLNPGNVENPSHGERLMGLETDMENLRDENNKDHDLIRKSIDKLSTRINGVLKK